MLCIVLHQISPLIRYKLVAKLVAELVAVVDLFWASACSRLNESCSGNIILACNESALVQNTMAANGTHVQEARWYVAMRRMKCVLLLD